MKELSTVLIEDKNANTSTSPWLILADVFLEDKDSDDTYDLYLVRNTEDIYYYYNPVDGVDLNYHIPFDDPDGTTKVKIEKGENEYGTSNVENTSVDGVVNLAKDLTLSEQITFPAEAANSNIFKGENGGNISFWMYYMSTISDYILISKENNSFRIRKNDTDNLQFIYKMDNTNYADWETDFSFDSNKWYHISINFIDNGTGNQPYFYIDNTLQTTIENYPQSIETTIDDSNDDLLIGTGNFYPAVAHIDDLRIYDSYLIDSQLESLYNFRVKKYRAYPFDLDISSQNSNSELPQLQMTVGNAKQILSEYIDRFQGGINSKVNIRVINYNNMSDGSYIEYSYNIISSKIKQETIIFTLAGDNLLVKEFPSDLYLANFCRFKFKSAACGYSGTTYTSCPKTYEACKDRENEERFGGFLGLDKTNFKLV